MCYHYTKALHALFHLTTPSQQSYEFGTLLSIV